VEIIPYAEEHRIFREPFRRFLEKEIISHVYQWKEDGIMPRWAWKKLGDRDGLARHPDEAHSGWLQRNHEANYRQSDHEITRK
jgi:acyl-CoA dehydrogenase